MKFDVAPVGQPGVAPATSPDALPVMTFEVSPPIQLETAPAAKPDAAPAANPDALPVMKFEVALPVEPESAPAAKSDAAPAANPDALLNEKLMSETTDNDDSKRADSGILALQLHTGPPMVIRFRNLKYEVLDGEAAK